MRKDFQCVIKYRALLTLFAVAQFVVLSCTETGQKLSYMQVPVTKQEMEFSSPTISGSAHDLADTAVRRPELEESIHKDSLSKDNPSYQQEMEFVEYNDDGDYYMLLAKDKDSMHYFVNNVIEDRSLNQGDVIRIIWENGTISIAGDGETPAPAEIVTAIKKINDGKVSQFRKFYKKQLTYVPNEKEKYSAYYADKIYRSIEYYVVNTVNEDVKKAISAKDDIMYSISEEKRNARSFLVATISVAGKRLPIEWLYIDQENGKLYEWDGVKNVLKNEFNP
ncbi:hypothetical protein [Sphingobacterium pedocola]|uniref:Uncharacterized protein n=1 Tax=Sphingobacterium pedocola TaxID=2082722 RepID=A0ABR9T4L2_9SPHI|nr:hypothetical protein [Sphingobacterium pedocola]MBE8719602.1 hypothetical protein [Sphingobacterium pedocola]